MAADTHVWIGGAPKLAQVDTITPGGTIEATDLFIVQLEDRHGNVHTMSVAAGDTNATAVVTALKAQAVILKAAATAPWNAVTCSGTATFIITADTAGEPFWATASTTEANGDVADAQTFVNVHTTPPQSNIWDHAENYDTGIVPVSTDTWIAGPMAGGTATDIYGSDQSAIELAAFTVQAGSNISIGDPRRYLQIHATAVNLEAGGTSAGTICLDVDHSTSFNVRNCKAATAAGSYGLYLVGDGTANTVLNIASTNTGKIGVAALAGEVASFGIISCYAGTLVIGSGVTMTTLNAGGGTIENNAAATTVNNEGATLTHAAGAVTNMYLNGGTAYFNATATTATIYVRPDAVLDFSQDSRAKTITNPIQVSKGATVRDPNGVVANLRLYYVNCRPEDVTFEGPANKTATWA